MKLKDLVVNGVTFVIGVDGDGRFSTIFKGDEIVAPTLETLILKLKNVTKKASTKMRIEFWRWEGRHSRAGELKHGVVTGVHGSNRNLLIEWDNGKKEQESYFNEDTLVLSPVEQVEYIAMRQKQADLEKQVETFHKRHSIDLKAAAAAELKKAGVEGGS